MLCVVTPSAMAPFSNGISAKAIWKIIHQVAMTYDFFLRHWASF
jgi:hypothetical protein